MTNKTKIMLRGSKIKGLAPSDDKLGAHSSRTPLEIITVNVRGMNKYVDLMKTSKEKYKMEGIRRKKEKEKEKGKSVNVIIEDVNNEEKKEEYDANCLLLCIFQNKNLNIFFHIPNIQQHLPNLIT